MGRHDDRDHDTDVRPLLRERVGTVLRERRHDLGLRLVDVAQRAGVSPQYLSEVERGVKDPSSEILEAAASAVGFDVDDLLAEVLDREPTASVRPVVHQLRSLDHRRSGRPGQPVCRAA